MSQRSKTRRARAAAAKKGAEVQRDAQGRVHLALHRDPASGREYLALIEPVFKEAWQNEITTGAANTARGLLREHPSLERTIELARTAMAATSRLSDGLLAQAPAGAVACTAGCDHCCYQPVGLTPPEALAIVDHLQRTLSTAELERLAAAIAERHEKTAGLSSAERFSTEYPCPFLVAGQCSIYEVRPLACRGMNALDGDECAQRLRDPEARAKFLATGSGGRSFMEPIRAAHAVSAGLQLSLSEIYALDMRPLELTAALHLLLNGEASNASDWLSGQTPFEAALCDDKTTDQGLRELSGTLLPGRAR
jgi:Fe-S-cluster containining protein